MFERYWSLAGKRQKANLDCYLVPRHGFLPGSGSCQKVGTEMRRELRKTSSVAVSCFGTELSKQECQILFVSLCLYHVHVERIRTTVAGLQSAEGLHDMR